MGFLNGSVEGWCQGCNREVLGRLQGRPCTVVQKQATVLTGQKVMLMTVIGSTTLTGDKFNQAVKALGQQDMLMPVVRSTTLICGQVQPGSEGSWRDNASKQVCTLLTSSAYSRSSTVFWRTDRGSLK